MEIPGLEIRGVVERALAEDVGWGDITTQALVPPDAKGQATIVAREEGILCGLPVAACVFHTVDRNLGFTPVLREGAKLNRGDVCASLQGSLASILIGERVALNFLQRLSGIASMTARYVDAVRGLEASIVDTRKTMPGLRLLEKYAVRVGGGSNHRMNLSDGVLIKDNHLGALRAQGKGIRDAIKMARRNAPHTVKVEIEVESYAEAREALDGDADIILLDNMSTEEMRRVVEMVGGRALLEASGGITLDNVRAVAETGVDIISVGALTHSVKALDLSLEIA